jgi:glycosyltransferase involved in cell wall biosynthesis
MIKVLAITGGNTVPSARFRIREYIPYLNNDEIIVNESIPLFECYTSYKGLFRYIYYFVYILLRLPLLINQFRYDFIWLQREILPTYITLEFFIVKPIIYDVDDAVFIGKRQSKVQKYISQKAKSVIVGNSYLYNWYSQYNNQIFNVPTVVDTNRYFPINNSIKNKFVIGWIGTSSNFYNIDLIAEALGIFLHNNPDCVLHIVSNEKYYNDLIPFKSIINIKWDYSLDVKCINDFNVGIMPLIDSNWSRGKCSFKLIQYLACGIPVIASPVGMNIDVLTNLSFTWLPKKNEEWIEAMNEVKKINKLKVQFILRERVLEKYNITANVNNIKNILMNIQF